MLTLFDDYPIHQTPDPVAVPVTTDRDVYERYWFNGYSRAADMYLGIGAALYPHLGIQDCGISIVHDGVQHAFHASARATEEPTDMRVGPFDVEIVDPMRSCRVTLDDNETDFACELLFEGRTANIEEPRHTLYSGLRRTMDTTRFMQLGTWDGWIRYDGKEMRIDKAETLGTKDRSWGQRGVGGTDPRGAPPIPAEGGLLFLWAPLHFDDVGVAYQLFEDYRGRPLYQVGGLLPTYDGPAALPGVVDPDTEPMKHLEHELVFEKGSRMVKSATIAMTSLLDGRRVEIELEKQFTYRMKGIGYMHPEWGHGLWKGELAMASEKWDLADVDDTALENQHVQHLMKARMDGKEGIGVLEQIVFGPYRPYGFTGVLDPLP